MKKVEAVIRHYKLEDVKNALTQAGIQGMTVTEVRGFGRQRGKTENFRGSEYNIDFIPKMKLEIIVPTDSVERLIGVIAEAAQTGKIGDGKVWSTSVANLLRVRTGEKGTEAI